MGVIIDLVKDRDDKYIMKECKELINILDKISDDSVDAGYSEEIRELDKLVIDKIISLNGLPIKSVSIPDGYKFPDGSTMSGNLCVVHSIKFTLDNGIALNVEEAKELDKLEEKGQDITSLLDSGKYGREVYNLEVYIPEYTAEGKYIFTDDIIYEISKDLYDLFLEKGLKEIYEV